MSTTPAPWTPGPSAEARTSSPARDELLDRLKQSAAEEMTELASKERRLLGGVIDYALVNAVFFGIDRFMAANAGVLDPSPESTALNTALVMTTLIAAAYFIGCWMLFGATFGMRIAGIRVADATTGAPLGGG